MGEKVAISNKTSTKRKSVRQSSTEEFTVVVSFPVLHSCQTFISRNLIIHFFLYLLYTIQLESYKALRLHISHTRRSGEVRLSSSCQSYCWLISPWHCVAPPADYHINLSKTCWTCFIYLKCQLFFKRSSVELTLSVLKITRHILWRPTNNGIRYESVIWIWVTISSSVILYTHFCYS